MQLVIFDIDGTVVDSTTLDDECFIKAFKDLYAIDLGGSDWNDFEYVTDSGLTNEIFQKHLNRRPTEEEVTKTQNYFFDLLSWRSNEFKEVPGASGFISKLEEQEDSFVAFATGGWKRTALLKLECLGLPIENYVLRSADDHYKRTEITMLAIKGSIEKYGVERFDSITYFGDGPWDLKASRELNLNFVGVDHQHTGKLNALGAEIVISDFLGSNESLITAKTGF